MDLVGSLIQRPFWSAWAEAEKGHRDMDTPVCMPGGLIGRMDHPPTPHLEEGPQPGIWRQGREHWRCSEQTESREGLLQEGTHTKDRQVDHQSRLPLPLPLLPIPAARGTLVQGIIVASLAWCIAH